MNLLPCVLVSLALSGPPRDVREVVRQGNDLLRAGQPAEALEKYKDAEIDLPPGIYSLVGTGSMGSTETSAPLAVSETK